MTQRATRTNLIGWLSLTGALTSFFLLLEVMKDVRDAQWSGYGGADLAGMAIGAGLYYLVLLLAIILISRALFFLHGVSLTAVSGFIAGALTWALLSPFREFFPTFEDALVAAGLLGIAVVAPLLDRFTRITFRAACMVMTVALLTGVTAAMAASYLHWFDADRGEASTNAAVIVCLCAGLAVLLAWRVTVGRLRTLRIFVGFGQILLPLVVLLPPHAGHGPAPDARNRLLIVVDTLRADVLAPYGGAVATPHIAALAEDAILFEQCYSTAPWTPPAMTSLFSGQYPPGLNPVTPPEAWLDQLWRYEVPRLELNPAAPFDEAGYATGAFVSNALVPQFPNFMAPFDATAFYHPMLLRPAGAFARLPFLRDMLAALVPTLAPVRPLDTTAALTRAARWFIRQHRDAPFFLYVHYMTPHAPYNPPARFREHTGGPWPFFYPYPGGERWGIPIVSVDYQLPAAERDYVRMLYEGQVRYVDHAVGRVLQTIDASGLRDYTDIVFTSDHGEELWEHGHWGHGQSLYDELIRVPLITDFGAPPGRVVTPVSLIDGTALLALDAPHPEWRGTGELRAVAEGTGEVTPRPIFAQATSNKANPPLQTVREGAWKLIREANGSNPQLYNLHDDPGEQHNLAAVHPERVAALNTLLDDWQATFQSVFPGTGEAAPAQRSEMLEKLEALGYLQ